MLVRLFSLALMPIFLASAAPPDFEARIEALLAQMTLEEKLGQLSQSTSMAHPISNQIKDEIRRGRWGSFLNAGLFPDRLEAQRIATTESRLKIPLVFGRDVIHGYRTVFPIPLGQAASFDPALIEQAARVAAREMKADGIHWTFTPMLDIARDPRWGRIAESPGEDPLLASQIAAAIVRGFQSEGVAACAKHFAGYGAAEAGRDYNSAWIPEVLLRDVYLPPFRAAVDAGVLSVMTGFNALNGIPVTGHKHLLRDILRQEWGFQGLIVSDYTAIHEMVLHGFAADEAGAAAKALRAGIDMEMVSTNYFDRLRQLVESGKVEQRWIDDAVRQVLRFKFRLGLFDAAIPQPPQRTTFMSPAALDTTKRVAAESIVLLQNQRSTLPLATNIHTLAVIGPLADSQADQLGTWAMDGQPPDVQTPLAALRAQLGSQRIAYVPGLRNSRDVSHDQFQAAADAARNAGAVVFFLGEEQLLSGEARSRAFLDLPGAQEDLVRTVASAAPSIPKVAIIMAGRPLTFARVASLVDAVLYAWHPGVMGGPAITELLFGLAAPSGRLPVTFPRTVGQLPIYYNHLNTGRPPSAQDLGIPTGTPLDPKGYVSKYLDVDFTPQYPFGFGLTYSTIAYSDIRLSATAAPLTASATIRNTGPREAEEVVQLYTRCLAASVAQPVRQLRAFRRVRLKPGESQVVSFEIKPADLAFTNEEMRLVTEPGNYILWIAPDSASGLEAAFTVRP